MSTTLLAVDDSKTMRKVLEITFASEDYKTLLAANADEALQLLHAEAPSVAVVDAGLGTVSGYDLCQQIKAQAPSTAVLVLSSKQQPYDRGRGSAVGADDFMDKPFDTQQLLDKVKALANSAGTRAASPHAVAAAAAPVAAVPPAPAAPPAPEPRAQTLSYGSPSVEPAPPRPAPAMRPQVPRTSTTSPGLAPSPNPPPALVAKAVAATDNGQLAGKLGDLGLSGEQVQAVMALSREIVERVVWEVVPTLAETLIKEEIRRLTGD